MTRHVTFGPQTAIFAFGFKSVEALMALVELHLGGYDLRLPGRAAV